MKTSFLLLILAVAFSTNVFAKKVQISSTSILTYGDGPNYSESVPDAPCFWSSDQIFQAGVHARKGNLLSLQLMTESNAGDTHAGPVNDYGSSWVIPKDGNFNVQKYGADFTVERGQSWSLVWVLENTKGKGRVVDAREVYAGTCASP